MVNKKTKLPYVEEVVWQDVKETVRNVSPEFADIIEEIDPSNKMTFIRARYPFGAKIVSNGIANLLTETGEVRPVNDARMPDFIRNKLDYSLVPLGFVLKNTIEVYREMEGRIFTIAACQSGLDIGIWEHYGWTTPYSINAGARSLYMVPKITLASAHKRLKRDYQVTKPPPKRAFDHWSVLHQITQSIDFPEDWYCEVLYLPKIWIEKLQQYDQKHGLGWGKLNVFLMKKFLEHSSYGRRVSIFDIVWELFARSLDVKGVRPNSYVLATLKHLAFVGTGGLPGSAPFAGSTELGPIPALQKIYLECYGLKEYIPTIMQPQYFDINNPQPIYYSLQTPTLLESALTSRNLTSIIDNIRELKELTDHFLSEAFDEHLKIANTSINDIMSQLKFDFFHEKAYAYGNDIRPSSEMPIEDARLVSLPCPAGQLKFADTSAYLHGCVRINRSAEK